MFITTAVTRWPSPSGTNLQNKTETEMNKKNYNAKPFSIFMSYIAGHKKLFGIDMLCALLVALIDLIFPYVSRYSMKVMLPNKLYATFFTVMAVMVLAYVLKAGLYYVITVIGHKMGVLVESDMRRDVFTHMQSLSFSYYDHNRTGVLMSRITSDLFEITELAHHGPENIVICTLTIVGALAVMFVMQWQLALVITLALPLCAWFTIKQRIKMKEANIEVKRKTAEIYSAIESSISGIRTAKAFANEDQESDKFDRANEMFRGSKVEYYKSMGLFNSGMEFTTGIVQVVVIAVGGLLIMQNKMNYIDLITFSLYVSTFVSPVRKLTQFAELYMQGTAGFARFLEVMRTEPTIKDAPDAMELGAVEGKIDYNHVSFNYGNGIPVLSDVDLHIVAGQCGRRPVRRRKDDAVPAAAEILRRVRRQRNGGRHRRAPCDAGKSPPQYRRHSAGCIHVRRYDTREHPLRPSGRDRQGDRRGRGQGADTLRDNGDARRLRQLYRRARRDALRRTEAENIHRARIPEKPEDTYSRRGDLSARHRDRAAHSGVA